MTCVRAGGLDRRSISRGPHAATLVYLFPFYLLLFLFVFVFFCSLYFTNLKLTIIIKIYYSNFPIDNRMLGSSECYELSYICVSVLRFVPILASRA